MSNFKIRSFAVLIFSLIIIGIIIRLEPLLDEQRMLKSVSEDGYLMMTIARNISLGLGMSTAEGTIPTNGTQPLTTLLWAGAYWLEEGDKVQTVIWIILLQFLFASRIAFLLWQLGKQVLQPRLGYQKIAALAAATWYVSPVAFVHTVNGLETTLYGFMVLWIVLIVVRATTTQWTFRYSVLLGVLLGFTFLVRNDAAFFILAVCLLHLLMGNWQQREIFQRLLQVNVMGITSILVASPWLIYNQLNFGSIMPISGQSQSLVPFGHSLSAIPTELVEYFFVFLPIPRSIVYELPVVLACTLILISIIVMMPRLWSHLEQPQERRLFVLVSLYLLGLCCFYGLFFGAPHFLARYFFPISPFLALLWAAVIIWAWSYLPWRSIRYGLIVFFLSVIVGLSVRYAYKLEHNVHFHIVQWVQEHVLEDEWVGAQQTGTLGYFHDRTINLDGKVNPDALKARYQGDQKLMEYIIEKQIHYLVDWIAIADWIDKYPLMAQYFEIIVKDDHRNLAVLKRKD